MSARLSATKRTALAAVADGRVQYGIAYQSRARRHPDRSEIPEWLIDGYEAYGQNKRTYTALEDTGLIHVRHEDVPMRTAPAETRTYRGLRGQEAYDLPERQVPADPGWRAHVVLTEAGAVALQTSTTPAVEESR